MKEGWKMVKLGEVSEFQGGSQPPKNEWIDHPEEGYVRMLQIRDFTKSRNVMPEYVKITSKLKTCESDDVMIGRYGASVGKILSGLSGAYNVALMKSIPNVERVSKKYIKLYFESPLFQTRLLKMCNQRAAQAGFSREDIFDYPFPLPPLSEQTRIVSLLDDAFGKLERSREKALKLLDDAKEIFQAQLKKEMTPKKGWEVKTLGEVCEILRGKRFVRADIVENGVPCIHYGDIYTYYGLSTTKTKGCISPELAKKMRFAEKNDVVVVQAGENKWDIGVGVAYFGEEPAAVHDACFILKHKQDPMFISYYLRSNDYHWYLHELVNEGKICSFLRPALANAPFPLPPLSEQSSIVSRLDVLSSQLKQIEEKTNKYLADLDELKQSLLKKAFEGKL